MQVINLKAQCKGRLIMPNLIEVNYEQTGKSKSTNAFGMRDMQEKAYEQRDAKYLL